MPLRHRLSRRRFLALAALATACGPAPAAPSAPAPAGPGAPASAPPPSTGSAAAPTRAPERVEVVVAIVAHNLTQLPFYVGLKAGLFEAEGLAVTLTPLPIPTAIASLVEGQVGYATAGGSVIRAAASGLPVRLIAGGKSRPDWQLMGLPAIGRVEDLRGKRLGVTAPTAAATLVTYELLATHGIGRADVDAINLQSTEGVLQGLLAGQVDGGLVAPPHTVKARREGLKTLAYPSAEIQVLQGGLGTSVQRIRERPAEVEAVLRGILRSIRAMQENRELVLDVLAERFELERDVGAELYDEIVPPYLPDASASDAVIQREIAGQEEALGRKLDLTTADVADFGPLLRAQRAVGVVTTPG